jgi:hypothetical protein
MNILKSVIHEIKRIGLFKTIIKIINYPYFYIVKNIKRKKILSITKTENRFAAIYDQNYWNDNTSRSGIGSNLDSTKNVIRQLPILISKFNINSILDAPCGDFGWMKYVLSKVNVSYLGGDIVEKIIYSNTKKNKSKKIKFKKINIIRDDLPISDLMICRDCLFHFSFKDIFLFLNNFIISKIKFLLVTSHHNNNNLIVNKDIITGDFRKIDLFSEPFNFQKSFLFAIKDKDKLETSNYKYLYLFRRNDVKNFLRKNNIN